MKQIMNKIAKKRILTGIVVRVVLPAVGYFVATGVAGNAKEDRNATIIQGRVISTYGPVENARVRIAGEDKYTLTDREGRYELLSAHPPGTRPRVTAGKEGWFNNGQVAGGSSRMPDILLNPVYLDDRSDYRFISPVTCSRCHVNLTRYYDQAKMAHTTSNPKVLDMYYGTDALLRGGIGPGYRLDNPQSDGNCTSCHAPSIAGSIPRSQDLNDVLRSPLTEWDGISCDYCHKVRKVVKDKTKPSGRTASDTRIRPKKTVNLKFEYTLEDSKDEPVAEARLIYRPVIRPWAKMKSWLAEDILITSSVW